MQLVEDFEANAVPGFARLGVRDEHAGGGLLESGEVGERDHLVGYYNMEGEVRWFGGEEGEGRDTRYAISIQAFSTSSVMPTYLDELRGFGSSNFTFEYSTMCIAGAVNYH